MWKNKIEQSLIFREGMMLLSRQEKDSVRQALELYEIDPYNTSLRNHPLREWDKRIRSISANDDLRIILRDRGEWSIFLMDVGDHERVYR